MTSPGEQAACGEILHRHGLKNTPARRQVLRLLRAVSYTHLTLPTIQSV